MVKGEKMAIFDNVVKFFKGDINNKTQRVTWSNDEVRYTSAFMQSVEMFIAREFSKLEINHRQYTKQQDGGYLVTDKLGSDIFETLNFAANGYMNNTQWRRELVRRIVRGQNVYLKPKREGVRLVALEFVDLETYRQKPDDILAITSPMFVSDNSTLYDDILSRIGSELKGNKLRGFLKINANLAADAEAFKRTAQQQIQTLQEVAEYNGLGVIDGKANIEELKNEYAPVDPEAVKIIKREILNGFGFSEKLLTGEYTEDDYSHFFDNVLKPLIREIETELTYKLLTTNARINNGEKNTFERVKISVNTFSFATSEVLVKLAEANTNGAFLTVNEIRKLLNHDPIQGGDVFRTNLNSAEVTYGND